MISPHVHAHSPAEAPAVDNGFGLQIYLQPLNYASNEQIKTNVVMPHSTLPDKCLNGVVSWTFQPCTWLMAMGDVELSPISPRSRRSSSYDNCARAVTGSLNGNSQTRLAACSSFLKCTVTPATVTLMARTTSTPGQVTTTLIVDTVVQTVTVNNGMKARLVGPPSFTTNCPSSIPSGDVSKYCMGTSRFASACSCAGVTKSYITLDSPSVTISVTQTAATPTLTIIDTTTTVTSTTAGPSTCSTFTARAIGLSQVSNVGDYLASGGQGNEVYFRDTPSKFVLETKESQYAPGFGLVRPADSAGAYWSIPAGRTFNHVLQLSTSSMVFMGYSGLICKFGVAGTALSPDSNTLTCQVGNDESAYQGLFGICAQPSDDSPLYFGASAPGGCETLTITAFPACD